LTDAAGHPAIGDGQNFFRVVQNTTNKNLFYVVLGGSDSVYHITTFDASLGSAGQWTGAVFPLANAANGYGVELAGFHIAFRSVDGLVLVALEGDISGAGGSEGLAQFCVVDPVTGSQGAWITFGWAPPSDGSSWYTAPVGMIEGAGGIVHAIINRPTGGGAGTDLTRTYQQPIDSSNALGALVEIVELQSPEQSLVPITFPIDDLKSDGILVYLAFEGQNFDPGLLVEARGASSPTITFSFQSIAPAAATGASVESGIAVVPAGFDYGLIFTDVGGLEYGQNAGPGVFAIFSTTDGTNSWIEVAVDTGSGFGAAAVLGSLGADTIRGVRANGPVFRPTPPPVLAGFLPQYIRRHGRPGN
jgi:hypothetical protein